MLRPSRPMMRPFMSSAGSWTTDTVVSAAWPAASRCMTTERMLRTRRSASRLVSSSIWRTACARSRDGPGPRARCSRICFACDALRPATRSSSRTWRSRSSTTSTWCCAISSSRAVSALRCWSMAASFVCRRSSIRPISVRRALRSASALPAGTSSGAGAAAGGAAVPLVLEPASAGARRESSEAPATRPAASTTAAITISIFGFLSLWAGGAPTRVLIDLFWGAADQARSTERRKPAGRRPFGRPVRWRLGASRSREEVEAEVPRSQLVWFGRHVMLLDLLA